MWAGAARTPAGARSAKERRLQRLRGSGQRKETVSQPKEKRKFTEARFCRTKPNRGFAEEYASNANITNVVSEWFVLPIYPSIDIIWGIVSGAGMPGD